MIQASELRKDNIVFRKFLNPSPTGLKTCYASCKIKSIGIERVIYECKDKSLNKVGYDNIYPIQLTEDWLLRLGFVVTETNNGIECYYFGSRYSIFKPKDCSVWIFCDGENALTNFEHIHTLQNIWFALTNQELTLKDS